MPVLTSGRCWLGREALAGRGHLGDCSLQGAMPAGENCSLRIYPGEVHLRRDAKGCTA